MASPAVDQGPVAPRYGKWVVLGVFALALLLSAANLAYQWSMTQRTAEFYGPQQANLVVNARQIFALRLEPGGPERGQEALHVDGAAHAIQDARDVSAAPGIKHIQRALVSANGFEWPPVENVQTKWRYALRFADGAQQVTLLLSGDGLWLRAADAPRALRVRPAASPDPARAPPSAAKSPFLAFLEAQFAVPQPIPAPEGPG